MDNNIIISNNIKTSINQLGLHDMSLFSTCNSLNHTYHLCAIYIPEFLEPNKHFSTTECYFCVCSKEYLRFLSYGVLCPHSEF